MNSPDPSIIWMGATGGAVAWEFEEVSSLAVLVSSTGSTRVVFFEAAFSSVSGLVKISYCSQISGLGDKLVGFCSF
jgi:hypothetical protein